MQPYVLSVALLAGAAFIHGKSAAPELRPANAAANRVWKLLGKAAQIGWIALLAWGVLEFGLLAPSLGLLGSLGLSAAIAKSGPRPIWPGLSMAFAVVGLGLAAATLLGRT